MDLSQAASGDWLDGSLPGSLAIEASRVCINMALKGL